MTTRAAQAGSRRGIRGRFFVTEWNTFIHFAALEARLTWTGVN
jgi:hypothetical protein